MEEEGSDTLTVMFIVVFLFSTYLYSVVSEVGAKNICY